MAPEFAAVDLGLAEKLALRAVATATGVEPGEVVAAVREAGDLGQAAEQLLTATAGEREPSLQVDTVVDTLHEIARAEGSGSQGRKLGLLADLLALATPLEARYLLRLVTGNLRLGIGTPTILDALAQVYTGSRKDRPVLGAGLQHLLRPRSGRGHAGLRRIGRSSGTTGAARQSGAGDVGPAIVRRRRDSRPGWAGSAWRSTNTTACGCRHTAPLMDTSSSSPGGRSA